MSSEIDYSSIEIPTEKSPTQYCYTERRAELLQLVEEAGHPRAVNQTELAERYGVSQQQISKDLDRISEYVADHLGDDHEFIMESVFHGAMLNLVRDGEYFRAAKVARWWSEWITSAIEQKSTTSTSTHEVGEVDAEKLEMYEAVCRDVVPSTLSAKDNK